MQRKAEYKMLDISDFPESSVGDARKGATPQKYSGILHSPKRPSRKPKPGMDSMPPQRKDCTVRKASYPEKRKSRQETPRLTRLVTKTKKRVTPAKTTWLLSLYLYRTVFSQAVPAEGRFERVESLYAAEY